MIKSLFVLILLTAMALPAWAGNWSIAVPDALPEGGDALKEEGWRFFLQDVGPGDRYAVLNATTPGQVAVIDVPSDPKLKNPKRRARVFARQNLRIADHLDQITRDAPEMDIIGALRHVALTRIDPDRPLDLLILGSAVQAIPDWPELSMMRDDAIYIPSPDHLTRPVGDTAYGMGAEGREGLANVFVHLCPVADDLRSDEEAALQGFYAAYLGARSGMLVTWSTDLSTCFERFTAELRAPLEAASSIEATGTPRMVKVGPTEVVVKTEPTTVIVNGMRVEQFNLFSSAPHPTLPRVEVTTGVVYEPGQYPDRYKKAYCYFNIRKSGTNLRLDLGDKYPEQPPIWDQPSTTSLQGAGITRVDFEAGRRACQWPTD